MSKSRKKTIQSWHWFWSRLLFFAIASVTTAMVVGIGFGIDGWLIAQQEVSGQRTTTPAIPGQNSSSVSISPTESTPLPSHAPLLPPVSLAPVIPQTPPIHQNGDANISFNAPASTLDHSAIPKTSRLNKRSFGHFPYAEDNLQNLVKVGVYYERPAFLDREVAEAFFQLQSQAQKAGIKLIIISGFRSIADQEKLFQKQIQRRGSSEAAARLSAPPGFSEHHTGFAMDVGDGNNPDADLKFTFESTQAYRWLIQNAYLHGFEMSFPRNNTQGMSFEPWHWRYVKSPTASQIFASARLGNF